MTFSIVAFDPNRLEWGVAVQSKYFAVGTICPWARAGVGAIVTQAVGDPTLAERGFDLLGDGTSAAEVIERLLESDAERDHRQLGIIDASGAAASFTGPSCLPWAGDSSGKGYACQANLVVRGTAEAMEAAYLSREDERLEVRMMAALEAGQHAGGDIRGQQAAALLVVGENEDRTRGYHRIDLRVDDDPSAVSTLARLVHRHALFREAADPRRFEPLSERTSEVREILAALGQAAAIGSSSALASKEVDLVESFLWRENLSSRWDSERRAIDPDALEYLRATAGRARSGFDEFLKLRPKSP